MKKIVKLTNGFSMPTVGLGTLEITNKDHIVMAVLEAGYRHLDTATDYANEAMIGEALQQIYAGGVKREDLFITTKLWHSDFANVGEALKTSLKNLQLDYVDMYLIHWPLGFYCEPKMPVHKVWPQMEDMVDKGLTRGIGVSNFNT